MHQDITSIMPLVFTVCIILAVVIGIASYIANKKRIEGLRALASSLGMIFDESKNHNLAKQYGFLDKLAQGSNRYLFNTLTGLYQDQQVLVSDYHYETHSSSKGGRKTHHHYLSL